MALPPTPDTGRSIWENERREKGGGSGGWVIAEDAETMNGGESGPRNHVG